MAAVIGFKNLMAAVLILPVCREQAACPLSFCGQTSIIINGVAGRDVELMLNFSMPELILILVIALVVFGPGKLPEVGKAVGKGLNEFRRAMSNDHTKDETINIEAKPVEHKDDEKKTDEEKKVDAKKAEETK